MEFKILKSDRIGHVLVQKEAPIAWFTNVEEVKTKPNTIDAIGYMTAPDKNPMFRALPKKERGMQIKDLANTYKTLFNASEKHIKDRLALPEVSNQLVSISQQLNDELINNETIQTPKNKEKLFLEKNTNTYLTRLGLPTIKPGQLSGDKLYVFATLGDALLKVKCLESTYNNVSSGYLLTNTNMKLALLKLGWHEFNCQDYHLSGTVFEMLYYIANLHRNENAKKQLETALFGDLCSGAVENRSELLSAFDLPETEDTTNHVRYPFDQGEFREKINILTTIYDKTEGEIADALGISTAYLKALRRGPIAPQTTKTNMFQILNDLKQKTHNELKQEGLL